MVVRISDRAQSGSLGKNQELYSTHRRVWRAFATSEIGDGRGATRKTSRKVGDDQTKRVTTEPLSLTLITWLPTKKFTKIGYPSRYRHFRWFDWLSGIFNNRDAARWSVRSVGDRVVPAFCCLILTLVAGGAQAQTAIDATDSKRVQVLQIKDGTATKEGAVQETEIGIRT